MSTQEQKTGAEPPADELTGTVLRGRYTVGACIGEGGVGRIYEAREAPFGRKVAVKVLLEAFIDCDHTSDRFEHEARIISHLRHPNVVTLLDFGSLPDGREFIVMEYLEGGHLGEHIGDGLPVPEALQIAQEICRGLSAAHAQGIIHRDLKPENVLFDAVHGEDDVWHPRVVDFGMALAQPEDWDHEVPVDEPGTRVGTPGYMAPEQAYGKDMDARVDLYAVGVLLFQMLTGKQPFKGENKTATLLAHLHDPPPAMATVAPFRPVPAEIEDLVMRLLAKDPNDRPESASGVAAELGNLLAALNAPATAGVGLSASRREEPEITWSPRRARMAFAAIVVLGCGGLIGTLFLH